MTTAAATETSLSNLRWMKKTNGRAFIRRVHLSCREKPIQLFRGFPVKTVEGITHHFHRLFKMLLGH